MTTPLLATKLYVPAPRPNLVVRPRLIERLNAGLQRKLTLISAPAGFGKTTLVSAWLADCELPAAWLSLDVGENDPARFLTYLIAALQTCAASIGTGVMGVLQAPQPPPIESILTTLLNDMSASFAAPAVLVLDDYHVLDSPPVDQALSFLLDNLPPQLQLVIATREDPALPLARLRAGGQLTELRAADLRFTPAEAVEFLNQAMGLSLAADDIAALETRTEGWIAGLQLAAISLQGQQDARGFITSFTGSHHFVMDYLVEEVLQRQPDHVQTFLLRTSILDRLCGPLCVAVVGEPAASNASSASGQAILEYLDRANLFIVPLDDERRWYRYHHLFAELLRQRLPQSLASSPGEAQRQVHALHICASVWYEEQGLDLEAFHHATAAQDIERAERLIEGRGIPLHYRGAVMTILDWLASLPRAVLDARPWLWVTYGSVLLVNGHTTGVEEKLQAGEAALQGMAEDERIRNLIGQIAVARATLALTRYQAEAMLAQSRRALEYLHPNKLALRANANFTMGFGYFVQGERAASRRAYTEAIVLSQAARDIFTTILATLGLGLIEEVDTQLTQAAETYRRILQLAGDQPLQIVGEAHLGLARVLYEWNDLDGAERHGRQGLQLERQYESIIDRFIVGEVFLARLQLARGDVAGAAALLAQANQSARQRNFVYRIPEVAAAQVLVLIHQGNLAAAARLAQAHDLPLSRARVHLAQGDPAAALAALEPWHRQVAAKDWADERLKVLLLQALALQALALQARADTDETLHVLGEALALAAPGGFIRSFVDEGPAMAQLLSETAARGLLPDYADYIGKILAACATEPLTLAGASRLPATSPVSAVAPVGPAQPLDEPLSPREVEVLRLIAQGLSNQEICERLFLALDTVKGHNRKIFDKLQVQRRTEAVARARELGLL